MKLTDEFLMRFAALKQVTNDNPQTLLTFFKDRQDFRVLSGDVFRLAQNIRRLISAKKVHSHVSENFLRAWKEYLDGWEESIIRVSVPNIDELITDLQKDNDNKVNSTEENGQGADDKKTSTKLFSSTIEEGFEPAWHDGGDAFDMIREILHNEIEIQSSSDLGERHIENMCRIGLGALNYFETSIGINIGEAFDRWHNVNPILIPTHVSNKYGLTEKGSLFELLHDAVRAYVAGAPAACFAMCRAILEMVLKNHYVIEHKRKTKDGKEVDRGLKDIIVKAAKEYEYINYRNIVHFKDRADEIMHKYADLGKIASEDEKILLQFLKTLTMLIERAPER